MNLQKEIAQSFAAERTRYVLWVPVIFAAGIGCYFALYNEPPAWPALILALLAALGVRFSGVRRLIAWVVLIASLGFMAAQIRTHMMGEPVLRKTLYYREVVGRIDDIQRREKGERLILSDITIERVKRETGPQRISVSLREEVKLHIGDRIRVKATLFPPPGPAMPGAYDFARAFYFDRLGAVGFSTKAPEVIESVPSTGFEERLNTLRLSLAERIRAPMNADNGAVAEAMIVGEMSSVSDEIKDVMRDSGLYHVLSISGLHMSIAAGLVYFTLRFLLCLYPPFALRWPVKKIAAAGGLISAFIYLLLSGYPVPAVRSFVMIACVMAAVMIDRRGISLISLAWAAMLILIFQPDALLGASFQLSFAATVGILALYERFGDALYKSDVGPIHKLRLYATGLMATSLVATLATTPLVLYHFNRFTFWGILANMLMVPLASFWIMPWAVIALLLMPFGLEHGPLIALDHGMGWMIALARWFAGFPHAVFSVPSPAFWGILLTVAGGLWLCLWQQRWRLLGIPAMIIGMATIALHVPYDLLINDEGNKVAMRLPDNRFVFIRGTPDSFEAEAWLKAHGEEEGFTLKEVPDAATCDSMRCVAERAGHSIVVAKKKTASGLCKDAPDIVVFEEELKDAACENVTWRVDHDFLARSGAVGFRFTQNGIEIDKASAHRGKRPWVPRPYLKLYPAANTAMMPKPSSSQEKQ